MEQAATPTPQRNHIGALDSLRGLMSWWVVAGHLGTALAFHNLYNDLPVDVFIILSGFVIFRLIDLKREPYVPFIVRRGFRLFPAYLFALAVSVALLPVTRDVFAAMPFQGPNNETRVQLADEGMANLFPHLLVHLTLLQGLIPGWILKNSPLTLLGQAWSVSLEWQFYLLAPAAFYAAERKRLWLPFAIAIVALVATTRFVTTAYLGAKALMFGVGLGSYLFVRAVEFGRSKTGPLACWTGFALLSLAKGGLIEIIPLGLWAVVLLATMSAPGTALRRLNDALNTKPLLRLGTISYSTYLIHMVALSLTAFALNFFGVSHSIYGAILVIVTVAASYLASEFMFRFVETPLKR